MTQQEQRELLEEMPTDRRERLSEEVREESPKKWDDLPEWLRNEMKGPLELQPGEFVTLDDSEDVGIQVSKVNEYLDGLYVVENMRDEMPPTYTRSWSGKWPIFTLPNRVRSSPLGTATN